MATDLFIGKLGKAAPKVDDRTLKLATYLDPKALPPLPKKIAWQNKVPSDAWPMLGNDRYGDCVCAGYGHALHLWTANAQTTPTIVDENAVLGAYSAITGFKQSDPNTDQGTNMLDALNYWRARGINANKITSFVEIDPSNKNQVKYAIALFGVAYVGLALPISAQRQSYWHNTVGSSAKPNSWGGHCISGSNVVKLLDGTETSVSQLFAENRQNFWTYGATSDGTIVPTQIEKVVRTGTKLTLKVTLDDGSVVRVTPDHMMMLRSGEYVRADELLPGTSLMPLYSRVNGGGYEEVLSSEQWTPTHRAVGNFLGYRRERGRVIHHKNFNKRDNQPDNLADLGWYEHRELHQIAIQAHGLIAYAQSDAGRKRSSEIMSALWANPEWAAARIIQNGKNRVKSNERLAKENRCGFQAMDPDRLREIARENGKKNAPSMHTPEVVAKRGASYSKRYENDVEFREAAQARVYEASLAAAKKPMTEAQLEARRRNIVIAREAQTAKRAEKKLTNHKVASVEEFEVEDVYDLVNSSSTSNFAINGVFVHNCVAVVGYTSRRVQFVTWGQLMEMTWGFFKRYCDEAYAMLAQPEWFSASGGNAPSGFNFQQLQADLAQIRSAS